MTVHAPRLIRSPSCRVTLSPTPSSRLLTKVPLADPGSLMNQVPSEAEARTACSRLTPGSTGWAARAPPPVPHPLADEPDPPFRGVRRKLDSRAEHGARRLHPVVVDAIRGNQHGPGDAGKGGYGRRRRG